MAKALDLFEKPHGARRPNGNSTFLLKRFRGVRFTYFANLPGNANSKNWALFALYANSRYRIAQRVSQPYCGVKRTFVVHDYRRHLYLLH